MEEPPKWSGGFAPSLARDALDRHRQVLPGRPIPRQKGVTHLPVLALISWIQLVTSTTCEAAPA